MIYHGAHWAHADHQGRQSLGSGPSKRCLQCAWSTTAPGGYCIGNCQSIKDRLLSRLKVGRPYLPPWSSHPPPPPSAIWMQLVIGTGGWPRARERVDGKAALLSGKGVAWCVPGGESLGGFTVGGQGRCRGCDASSPPPPPAAG